MTTRQIQRLLALLAISVAALLVGVVQEALTSTAAAASTTRVTAPMYGYDEVAHDAKGALTGAPHRSVGSTPARGYNADGNLESAANANSVGTLSDFTWTLNEDGAPKQIATTRGATTTNEALTYDAVGRLAEACYSTTTCASAVDTISYAYDADSNVTQQVRAGSVPDPGTTNYTYNPADQLTQAAVSGSGTTNYTYNANGDVAGAGSDSYTYNLADELASTTQASTTTSYSYDGDGDRTESDTSGGADTTFTWDMIGSLPQIASEQTGSGSALRTYLCGPQGAISVTTPSQTSYLYRDPLGSITDSTSSTGSTQWQFGYDPYGNPLTTTDVGGSSPVEPLRYTGQYLDPELGEYDLRAREYDPQSMRFQSQDPLPAALTQPYAGAYVYADGDPAAEIDPTGQAGGGLGGCAIEGASSCPKLGTDPVTQYARGFATGVEQTVVGTPSALLHEAQFQVTSGCVLPEVALARPICAEHDLNTLKTTVTGTITTLRDCVTGTSDTNAQACGHIAIALAGTAAGGEGACTLADTLAAEETVPLYRAVSPGEFNDAVDSQVFRAGPNSMEGKWFADRPPDALRWGQKFYGDDPFHVVETRVPKSYADSLFANPNLDGIGPARYAEDLSPLNRAHNGIREYGP